MALVNARQGLTIGVGEDPPAGVEVRVPNTAAFASDLGDLLRELSKQETA